MTDKAPEKLAGFRQTVIRYRDEGGKKTRKVVRYGTEIRVGELLGVPAVVFEDQEDGTINAVSKSLVVEAFVEEENPKYGTFSRIETVELF